jgi:hypothetical protein
VLRSTRPSFFHALFVTVVLWAFASLAPG